jgi:REP element-mobilizing transposase RayT
LALPIYCNILDESLNYCIKEKGLSVDAYVYMSSHIHLIVTAFDGELQNVIRDFKKFTSKKLIEAIKEHPESRRECWWKCQKKSRQKEKLSKYLQNVI